MDEQLRKRLEEAAREEYPSYIGEHLNGRKFDVNKRDREAFIEGGNIGCTLGYKEAIAQAKEWLNKNLAEYVYGYDSLSVILADFETDMNKLWEEKV